MSLMWRCRCFDVEGAWLLPLHHIKARFHVIQRAGKRSPVERPHGYIYHVFRRG
jgi:hypothetical protein